MVNGNEEVFSPTKIWLDFPQTPLKEGKPIKEFDLEEELAIDDTNVNKEVMEQPARFAWVASLHEWAKDFSAQMKLELQELQSELDLKIREEAVAQGLKITEALVLNSINGMDEFKQKQRELADAQRKERLLSVARESFVQRKDMLISLCANRRVEMDSEIMTLKEKALSKVKGR
jgi:hypothetical protein